MQNKHCLEIVNNFDKYKNVKTKLLNPEVKMRNDYDYSIIIPTYNRSDTLERAIYSAINQNTNKKYCVIILDNNSEGFEPKEIKSEVDIFYFQNESNIGMFGNFNRCIELAPTEWFCILHDDDILLSNYVQVICEFISTKGQKYGAIGNLFGRVEDTVIAKSKKDKKNDLSAVIFDKIVKFNANKEITYSNTDMLYLRYVTPGCATYNKAKSIKIGGFNENFKNASDCEFFMKMNINFSTCKLKSRISNIGMGNNESMNESTKIEFITIPLEIINTLNNKFKVNSKVYIASYLINCSKSYDVEYNFSEAAAQYRCENLFNSKFYRAYSTLRRKLSMVLFLLK